MSQFLELFLYLDEHGQRVTIPELLQLPNGARLLPFIGRSGPGGAENGPNGPVNIPVVQANRNLNYNRPNRRMNRRESSFRHVRHTHHGVTIKISQKVGTFS